MTLCIAAIADAENKAVGPAIVVAADYKMETAVASAEFAQKCNWLNDKEWVSLMAAEDSARAMELIRECAGHLLNEKIENPAAAINLIKDSVAGQKRNLINEYLRNKYAITYEYFLKNGKSQFSEYTHREIELAIQRIKFQCQVLLCTFVNGAPLIIQIDDDGQVIDEDYFATIGSGSYIAQAVLCQRAHTSILPLAVAIYHVYEAMTLGAIGPGVGKINQIAVLTPEKNGKIRRQMLSDAGRQYMNQLFRMFGPKPIGATDREKHFGELKEEYLK